MQLFSEEYGRISALARGARKNNKRYGGSLEAMHTICLELTPPASGEMFTIKSSQIEIPRTAILATLERMRAAGRALLWVKRATSGQEQEGELWHSLNLTLDDIGGSSAQEADDVAASFGLRLLELMGFGLNFLRCVSCGKVCPEGRSAWLNPERGGLVCRACGGGPFQITAADRLALHAVAQGQLSRPPHDVVPLTFKIVERSLGAHMGWEDGGGVQDLGSRRKG